MVMRKNVNNDVSKDSPIIINFFFLSDRSDHRDRGDHMETGLNLSQ